MAVPSTGSLCLDKRVVLEERAVLEAYLAFIYLLNDPDLEGPQTRDLGNRHTGSLAFSTSRADAGRSLHA